MIRTSPKPGLRAVVIALASALAVSLLIILLMSDDAGKALYSFFIGPFADRYHAGNLIDAASLLMFTGLGVVIAFRSGTFNLGGEGQSYAGALIATQIALLPAVSSAPAVVAVPLILIASALMGGAIAAVSGLLRAALDIDELITSFLLSSAAVPIVDYLIAGPLRDEEGYLLATPTIPEAFRFTHILQPSSLNIGIVFAIVACAATALVLTRTRWGYELRMTGMNRRFATYGGIRSGAYLMAGMSTSGMLHGLAGALYVLGTRYMCVQGGTSGLGWNGIAVALIAENRPLAAIPAAIVFSFLQSATKTAMLSTGFSFELSAILQATVFLLITVKRFRGRRV